MGQRQHIESEEAKRSIIDYCLHKRALAVGVADLKVLERVAPHGHRPSDLMPRAVSISRGE